MKTTYHYVFTSGRVAVVKADYLPNDVFESSPGLWRVDELHPFTGEVLYSYGVYNIWGRVMIVQLDKGQDGCHVLDKEGLPRMVGGWN